MLIKSFNKNEMAIARNLNNITPTLQGYIDYCLKIKNNGIIGYETIDGNQIIFISSVYISDYVLKSKEYSNLIIVDDRLTNYFKSLTKLSKEEIYDNIISGRIFTKLELLLKKEQDHLDIISNLISDLFDEVKSYNETLGFNFKYNEVGQSETINKDFLAYVKNGKFYFCKSDESGTLTLTNNIYHDILAWCSKHDLLVDIVDYIISTRNWYKTRIAVDRKLNRLVNKFRGFNAPIIAFSMNLNTTSIEEALSEIRQFDYWDAEIRGTMSYSDKTDFEYELEIISNDNVNCKYTIILNTEFLESEDTSVLFLKLYGSDKTEITGKKLEN